MKSWQIWLELLQADIEQRPADLRKANLYKADLRKADLRKADLQGANLWCADLRGADLLGADLRETNLREADLRKANLQGAILLDADLLGADLRDADLQGAILRDANLREAYLRDADLQEAYLRDANLRGADLRDADLRKADLRGANLRDANLSGTKNLLNPISYLRDNFQFQSGLIVYKIFHLHYAPHSSWQIKQGAILTEVVNPNRQDECGCGINVATPSWIHRNMAANQQVWKCRIPVEALCSIVVPYNTDGKIRCGMIEILEIVDFREVNE